MFADDLASYVRSTGWLGGRFVFLKQTSSTNDVVRRMAEAGALAGLVAAADEQLAGRGRLDRRWSAPPGACLLFSMLFRPPEPFAENAFRATMVCGLALVEVVRAYTGIPAVLKWPNDLIVSRAGAWFKLAGMLSEIGLAEGVPAFTVVGIGLNVNVAPEELPLLAPNATSLLAESGQLFERAALLEAFLARAETLYAQHLAGWDPWPAWRAVLAWLGQPVCVQTPTERVMGVALDVAPDGALLVRVDDGSVQRFPVGDVSLRQ